MSGQTLQKAFVPLAGGGVAVYTSSGLVYYRHKEGLPGPRQGEPGRQDWLGSSRFASTPSRTMYSDGAYAPFGEPYADSGTSDLSFTGMNQDTVSGLFDFAAREYSIQGRWPSPDPSGIASVYRSDPQTWNRYAYVRNSPLQAIDPTGMKCGPPVSAVRRAACDVGGSGGDSGGDLGGAIIVNSGGDGGGGCGLFCQASAGLFAWLSGGIAPTPDLSMYYYSSAGPNEFDQMENPCSGECRHNSIISTGYDPAGIDNPNGPGDPSDPCVYLNNSATKVEYVDYESSPGECSATNGTWVNPGQSYRIDPITGTLVPGLSVWQKLIYAGELQLGIGGALQLGAVAADGTVVGLPAGVVMHTVGTFFLIVGTAETIIGSIGVMATEF